MVHSLRLRETAPQDRSCWLREGEDTQSILMSRLKEWMESIAEMEHLFVKHVYENPECSNWDFRLHRHALYILLANGEGIASDFIRHSEGESETIVKLIDEKLQPLQKTLFEWHGPVETDSSIPDSFKESFAQYKAGNLVDFDLPSK